MVHMLAISPNFINMKLKLCFNMVYLTTGLSDMLMSNVTQLAKVWFLKRFFAFLHGDLATAKIDI